MKRKLKKENCDNLKSFVSEGACLNLMGNVKNYVERHEKSSQSK